MAATGRENVPPTVGARRAHRAPGRDAARDGKARPSSRSSSKQSSTTAQEPPELVEDRVERSTGVEVRNRYEKTRLLGKGGFAKCYLFRDLRTSRHVAGKVVLKSSLKKERAKQKLLGEIKIHKSLSHPRVVRFLHFFEDHRNVYIILDVCHNRTLMDLLRRRKRLTEPEVQYYALQMLEGMAYLHEQRVIHRDLKLGNLFITKDMQLCIGDLGLATRLRTDSERKRTICGTPNYIAPEILQGGKQGHSFEVDVWSLGCILFTLLVGRPPFETRDVKTTYSRIKSNIYSFPDNVPVSETAKSLVRWILSSDPCARPTLSQIRRHAFFSESPYVIPDALPASALHEPPTFARKIPGAAEAGRDAGRPAASVLATRDTNRLPATSEAVKPSSAARPSDARGRDSSPRQRHAPTRQLAAAEEAGRAREGRPSEAGTQPDAEAAPTQGVAPGEGAEAPVRRRRREATSPTSARHERGCGVRGTHASGRREDRGEEGRSSPRAPPALRSAGTARSGSRQPSAAARNAWSQQRGEGAQQEQQEEEQEQEVVVPEPCPAVAAPTDKDADSAGDGGGSGSGGMRADDGTQRRWAARQRGGRSRPSRGSDAQVQEIDGEEEGEGEAAGPEPAPGSEAAPAVVPPPAAAAVVARDSGAGPVAKATRGQAARGRIPSTLETMHEELTKSFAQPEAAAGPGGEGLPAAVGSSAPQVWVSKWVDYTSKYGMGYLVCDGSVGVYFNDATKVVLASDNRHFEYVERRSSREARRGSVEPPRQLHTLDNYPPALKKKVTLLVHFRDYLHKRFNESSTKNQPEEREARARGSAAHDIPYVKKWVRTSRAILFRLSNRTVQVNFFDNSEILLSSEARVVTYVDTQGRRSSHTLRRVMHEQRDDIMRKLKYTKDILYQMIDGTAGYTK